ncbi:MAG: response regulator transcription factor [Chitinophagaceae bacterium]|nr:response regulator transcription factor [Chitinophagaceae bacterium]
MPKIALVDDHSLLRNALANVIKTFPGYEVLFQANNGRHFIQVLDPDDLPDIVLMDVSMPVMNGFETTRWLNQNYPEVRVIALSMQREEWTVIRMLRNGAKGFMLKETDLEDLLRGLNEVANKGLYINEILYKRIVHTINQDPETVQANEWETAMNLSEREKEFLRLICTEKSYREIATEMCLSPRTVDGYRDLLFEKTQVISRIGLVLFAFRNGIARI